MQPMTNSEIRDAESKESREARRGIATQVSQMVKLARSYELVWCGNQAEIRDGANGGRVVFSGTLAECRAEAAHRYHH